MKNKNNTLTIDSIRNLVYTIRGQQVMIDSDLAEIMDMKLKI